MKYLPVYLLIILAWIAVSSNHIPGPPETPA